MNDGNKLYRLINNNRLFFILTGSILFFIGFMTKYRVYSKTSSGMMLYFLVGIVCLTVAHLSSFKINKATSKKMIISCIYVIFFIAISFAFFLLFYFVAPSLHAAKWLMPIVNLFLFFLGIYTTIIDDFLLFTYGAKTYKFAISYEQSALAFFLFISILLFVFYFFTNKENRLFIKQIGITLLYTTIFTPLSRTYQNSYFSENLVNTRIDEFSFGNKGRIYVLVHAQIFDNIGLGEAATVPTNKQIQLHSDFFNLIKQLDIQ